MTKLSGEDLATSGPSTLIWLMAETKREEVSLQCNITGVSRQDRL